jgi:hypothetical protein
MRKRITKLWILISVLVVGCDKPIITIDLKGQPNIPAQPAPPRFQLVVTNSEMPNLFTYLLDTQTGMLWQRAQYTDLEDKPSVWVQQKFVESLAPSSPQSPMSYEILNILHPPIKKEAEKK